MAEPLKIPEAARADIAALHQASLQAQREVNIAVAMAYRFLGLDPSKQHTIDPSTGIVTPAAAPSEPTPIRADASG